MEPLWAAAPLRRASASVTARGIAPASVESAVAARCTRASWALAVRLLLGAVRSDIVPTWRTYAVVLNATARFADWRTAAACINAIGTSPTSSAMLVSHTSQALARAEPAQVLPFVSAAPASALSPVLLGRLVAEVARAGCHGAAVGLVEVLLRAPPPAGAPLPLLDSAVCEAAMGACAEMRRWDVALAVLAATAGRHDRGALLLHALDAVPSPPPGPTQSWLAAAALVSRGADAEPSGAIDGEARHLRLLALRVRCGQWLEGLRALTTASAAVAAGGHGGSATPRSVALALERVLTDVLHSMPCDAGARWDGVLRLCSHLQPQLAECGTSTGVVHAMRRFMRGAPPQVLVALAAAIAPAAHWRAALAAVTATVALSSAYWETALAALAALPQTRDGSLPFAVAVAQVCAGDGHGQSGVVAPAAAAAHLARIFRDAFRRAVAAGESPCPASAAPAVAAALFAAASPIAHKFVTWATTEGAASKGLVLSRCLAEPRCASQLRWADAIRIAVGDGVDGETWQALEAACCLPSWCGVHESERLAGVCASSSDVPGSFARAAAAAALRHGRWAAALHALGALQRDDVVYASSSAAAPRHVAAAALHAAVGAGDWAAACAQLSRSPELGASHVAQVVRLADLIHAAGHHATAAAALAQITPGIDAADVAVARFKAAVLVAATAASAANAGNAVGVSGVSGVAASAAVIAALARDPQLRNMRGRSRYLPRLLASAGHASTVAVDVATIARDDAAGIAELSAAGLAAVLAALVGRGSEEDLVHIDRALLDSVAGWVPKKEFDMDPCVVMGPLLAAAAARGVPVPVPLALLEASAQLRGGSWADAAAVLPLVTPAEIDVAIVTVCARAFVSGSRWRDAMRVLELGLRRSVLPPADAMAAIEGCRRRMRMRCGENEDAAHGDLVAASSTPLELVARGAWEEGVVLLADSACDGVSSDELLEVLRLLADQGRLLGSVAALVAGLQSEHMHITPAHFNTVLRAAAKSAAHADEVAEAHQLLLRASRTRADAAVQSFLVGFAMELDLPLAAAQPEDAGVPVATPCDAEGAKGEARRLSIGGGRWTSSMKQRLANAFPQLRREAPPTPHIGAPVFAAVAAQHFSGAVEPRAIADLWYARDGAVQRHLERLHAQSVSTKRAPAAIDFVAMTALLPVVLHSRSHGLEQLGERVFGGRYSGLQVRRFVAQWQPMMTAHGMARRAAGDRVALVQAMQPLDMLVLLARAIRRSGALTVASLVDRRQWLHLAESALQGAIPPAVLHQLCVRNARDIDQLLRDGFSCAEEAEVLECVKLTGALPRALISNPARGADSIRAAWAVGGSAADPGEVFGAAEIDVASGRIDALLRDAAGVTDTALDDIAERLGRPPHSARDMMHLFATGSYRLLESLRSGAHYRAACVMSADAIDEPETIVETIFDSQPEAERQQRVATGARLLRLAASAAPAGAVGGQRAADAAGIAGLMRIIAAPSGGERGAGRRGGAAWLEALRIVRGFSVVDVNTWRRALLLFDHDHAAGGASLADSDVAIPPPLLIAAHAVLGARHAAPDGGASVDAASQRLRDVLVEFLRRCNAQERTRHGVAIAMRLAEAGALAAMRRPDARKVRRCVADLRRATWGV